MNFSWVMDHFLYLPAIGVIALITAALGDLDDRLAATSQLTSTALITLIIGLLAFRAHWYAAAFTNEETFWGYTIERNPGSWMAQSGMGKAVLADGDPARAIKYLAAAAAENPSLAEMHTDLGNALAQAGQVDAGVAEMQRALQLDPYDANANNNLGIVLARQGQGRGSPRAFHHLAAVKAGRPRDLLQFGQHLFHDRGNWTSRRIGMSARCRSSHAIPRRATISAASGSSRAGSGRATADFAEAIRLKPDYVEARNNLGTALTRLGQLSAAAEQFRIVLQIDRGKRHRAGQPHQAPARRREVACSAHRLKLGPSRLGARDEQANLQRRRDHYAQHARQRGGHRVAEALVGLRRLEGSNCVRHNAHRADRSLRASVAGGRGLRVARQLVQIDHLVRNRRGFLRVVTQGGDLDDIGAVLEIETQVGS